MPNEWRLTDEELEAIGDRLARELWARLTEYEATVMAAVAEAQAKKLWATAWRDIEELSVPCDDQDDEAFRLALLRLEALNAEIMGNGKEPPSA